MHRKIAGAAALAAASVGGLTLLIAPLRASASGLRTPDDAVALGVLAIGALLLGWYLATALAALACLAARAAGRAWVDGERRLSGFGAPLARRLLLTGGSAAVVAAAVLSPAAAAPAPADLGTVATLADDLGWGATDENDEPTAEPTEVAPEDSPEPPQEAGTEPGPTIDPASTSTPSEDYTVLAGDSLWTIAAQHLLAEPTAEDIAAAWPRWYGQNDDVIGDNPDLIQPGQVLTVPDHNLEEQA